MSNMSDSNTLSAVVDNNIIVDLCELSMLNILFEVFDEVIIPRIIYKDEVLADVKSQLSNYEFIKGDIDNELGMETFYTLSNEYKFRNLSTHDKLAISIAKEVSYCCNSNDGLVRKACKNLEIEYIGILGVLEKAFFKKIISKSKLFESCIALKSDDTSCFISCKVADNFLDKYK